MPDLQPGTPDEVLIDRVLRPATTQDVEPFWTDEFEAAHAGIDHADVRRAMARAAAALTEQGQLLDPPYLEEPYIP